MKRALLTCCLVATFFLGIAQHRVAIPRIINYNNNQYKGGLQNWDIAQDTQGIMYFGNNEGLLTFNGRYWNIFPLPNATIVRSVAIDKNNRVYVGGQDELGYFQPDSMGRLQYRSLVDLIPEPTVNSPTCGTSPCGETKCTSEPIPKCSITKMDE